MFDINPDVDSLPETVTPAITVHINDLTITNARQNQSGAVRVQARATVTMDRCTVSNSIAWADDGGGIFVLPDGALTLTNSTVTGNFALLHAGGIRNDGFISVVSSTITNNDTSFDNLIHGLACFGAPALNCPLRNTIIAGNGPSNVADTGGSFTSLGYNIIGKTTDNSGGAVTTITPTVGDQFNTGATVVELQALASNGGPTPTHALGPGSIAIDQGESSGSSTDQRGESRPCDLAAVTNATGGDGADVGAFEVQGACFTNSPPDAVDDTRDGRSQQRRQHHRRAGQRQRSRSRYADHHRRDARGQRRRHQQRHLGQLHAGSQLHRHGYVHLHDRRRKRRHGHGHRDGHGRGHDAAAGVRVRHQRVALAAESSARERRAHAGRLATTAAR